MEEMKKCPHCGAIQKPERQTCIDCGRVLPEAHPEFAHELDMMADEKLTGRLDYDDPRSPSHRFKVVMSILGGILILASILCIILFGDDYLVVWFAFPIVCGAFDVLWILFPRVMSWVFSRRRYYGVPDYADDSEKLLIFVLCVAALIIGTLVFFWALCNLEPINRSIDYDILIGSDGAGTIIYHN